MPEFAPVTRTMVLFVVAIVQDSGRKLNVVSFYEADLASWTMLYTFYR